MRHLPNAGDDATHVPILAVAAYYPTSQKDTDGKDYVGSNKYVMRFPKGQLPPVGGFWSLTMYDENYFFVANPINRHSISAR